MPTRRKFDDRHGAVDSPQPPADFLFFVNLRRDVGCDLDHANDAPAPVVDRVVRSLQPQALASLGQTFAAAVDELAFAKPRPERCVIRALCVFPRTKQAVMLADDRLGVITGGFQKRAIGAQDLALRIEFDHGHGSMNSLD